MASDRALRLRGLALAGLSFGVLAGCGAHDPRRFRLAAPVLRDHDLDPVASPCRQDPKAKGKDKTVCAPEEYVSSFAWDAADNSLFRPIAKFFAAEHVGESENVNAFDEVPDSSWFVNRIGARPMSPEEAARGYCPYGPELTSNPPDGAWVIDHGKDNGANPGFRVATQGTKFMFKTDDTQVERATAATAIAARFYFAAGWWAPCDAVVYFKRSALTLKPGLKIKANVGAAKTFDEKLLDEILSRTGRRGDLYRATASRWLPGRPLGPFTYEGIREGDPNDVIAHENRRDLRGARIIADWLNHFDSREQNSMSTWEVEDANDPRSKGYVRHWYIDLGDCFGSEWSVDGFSKRHGYSYILDVPYMLEDFATLGIPERPWDRARRTPGAEIFGYFRAEHDPDVWRGEYPNPAFSRMTERDAAWGTRIIARFTPAHIAATVKVGDFTNPEHEAFLTRVLVERRMILLRRYFAKLSPLTDFSAEPSRLCAVDLARRTETYPASRFAYTATVRRGGGKAAPVRAIAEDDGRVCIDLAAQVGGGAPDDAPERYVVASIENGTGSGPIEAHLYDLGPARGLRLVGLARRDP